jgi:hypothetical protein
LQSGFEPLPFQLSDHATAELATSLRLIVLISDGQSLVLHIRPLLEAILSSKFFLDTRAMHVRSEPLINDNWNVVRCRGASRILPVRVGRRSLARQLTDLVCWDFVVFVDFFDDAVGVGLSVAGVVDKASIADGVTSTVCVGVGEIGTEYAAEGIADRASAAEPLPTPVMINGRAITSTTVAPVTNARLAQ